MYSTDWLPLMALRNGAAQQGCPTQNNPELKNVNGGRCTLYARVLVCVISHVYPSCDRAL